MAQAKEQPRQLLLDMDGVFVDFVRGCFRWFEKNEVSYHSIQWNLEKIICPELTPEEFWNKLNYTFWRLLPWHPQGRKLYEMILKEFGAENICLCTSPAMTQGATEGKIRWIEANMPELKRNFMICPVKQFASGPNRILVDDSESNREKFELAGGKTVLVPQPWNHRHHKLIGEDYDPVMVFEEVKSLWY